MPAHQDKLRVHFLRRLIVKFAVVWVAGLARVGLSVPLLAVWALLLPCLLPCLCRSSSDPDVAKCMHNAAKKIKPAFEEGACTRDRECKGLDGINLISTEAEMQVVGI